MKIRNDYVSNSSSSSFILGNHPMFDFFNITKKDIMDALVDSLGGVDSYNKIGDEEYKGNGPIWIYDLSNESEREEAKKEWGSTLKGWTATSTLSKNGEITGGFSNTRIYNEVIHGIADIYNVCDYELENITSNGIPRRFVRTGIYDPKTGVYGYYEELEDDVVKFCNKFRKDCGIIDNYDVLCHQMSRFFVHVDDNAIWGSKMVDDDGATYDTDSWTYDRVCEVLFKYLVKVGKIIPNDQRYLDENEIDPGMLTKMEKDNGEIYDVANGKELTWMDLEYATFTQCMHEG